MEDHSHEVAISSIDNLYQACHVLGKSTAVEYKDTLTHRKADESTHPSPISHWKYHTLLVSSQWQKVASPTSSLTPKQHPTQWVITTTQLMHENKLIFLIKPTMSYTHQFLLGGCRSLGRVGRGDTWSLRHKEWQRRQWRQEEWREMERDELFWWGQKKKKQREETSFSLFLGRVCTMLLLHNIWLLCFNKDVLYEIFGVVIVLFQSLEDWLCRIKSCALAIDDTNIKLILMPPNRLICSFILFSVGFCGPLIDIIYIYIYS